MPRHPDVSGEQDRPFTTDREPNRYTCPFEQGSELEVDEGRHAVWAEQVHQDDAHTESGPLKDP
ncbi:MAG: hypothetical protein ACI8Y4_002477 [Candidatus Poriferisodalaceae bacterium]|jgi:hypothetical protein